PMALPALDHLDDPLEVSAAPSSRNLLLVLWQRKSLVLLGLVVGVVGASLLYVQRDPVYQSSAQVFVVKKRSANLPDTGSDPRMSFYDDYVATHIELIKSPKVIKEAIHKAQLYKLKSFDAVGNNPEATLGVIRNGLSAGRSNKDPNAGNNNIFVLTYKGSDPNDC